MKRTILTIIFLALSVNIFAFTIGLSVDAGTLQDLFIKKGGLQFAADIRASVNDKFELRVPFSLSTAESSQFYDVGISLNYHPWKNAGLFMGLSLVQFGFANGETDLEQKAYGLNEISLGWTFVFFRGLTVEPSVTIRDPSGTYEDEYALIKGAFPCYSKYRVKLNLGWSFNLSK